MALLVEKHLYLLLQNDHALAHAFVFFSQALEFLVLAFAVAGAGSVHPLFDAALGDKLLLQAAQVGLHHLVHHVEEGQGYVAQLFGVPFGEEGLIVIHLVVEAAEAEHFVIAGM